MKVAVLVNASAGSARSLSPGELERLFRDANISADIVTVRENDFEKVLQQALRQPPDAIIGGGGDGTLSTIAAKLAGTGIPLGVLPLGTCNHFAKDLGIPMDLEEAVNCIGRCSAEPVDMGEVNGHLFINNSSIGAYPEIVREREDQRARLGIPKWLGNITAFMKVLRRWPLMPVRLELDGTAFTRLTPFVFVGNNEYKFSPGKERMRERLHAGELCVFTVCVRNFWSLVRLFWLALLNRLNDAQDFEAHFGRELIIHSHRKHLRLSRDGELCRLQSPLRYRARPGELLVFRQGANTPVVDQVDEGHRAHLGPALRS